MTETRTTMAAGRLHRPVPPPDKRFSRPGAFAGIVSPALAGVRRFGAARCSQAYPQGSAPPLRACRRNT